MIDPESPAGSLARLVADQAGRAPGHPWVESARSARGVDRHELAAILAQWRKQGVAEQRLGLAVADPVAFAALFVALTAAGATVVPLDALAPDEVNRTLLRAAGATQVVATDADRPPAPPAEITWADASTFLPQAPAGRPATSAGGACLLFSSGSTGPRKAIRLPEQQLLHVAGQVVGGHALTTADRCYNPLPLFHINAEVVALVASLLSGGTVVLDAGFHRTGFWPLMSQRSISWINAVPAIVAVLAKEPAGPSAPSSLRFVRSASAPLAAAVLERFERRYGVPVVESYGMTEAASQITVNPLRARRSGSVGLPLGVQLRVVQDDGADAAPDDVGRVLIRGRGVIRDYEGGAGGDRFDADGWLDTGDLGSLDRDGYLYLAARSGQVINRGGEKIFPREIEDVLRGHPAVQEAVVVGRGDPVLGQVPIAYVVPGPAAPAGLAVQLAQHCAGSLPRAHRPAEITLVPDLPQGPTGKTAWRLVADHDERRAAAANGRHGQLGRHAG